MSLDLSLLPMRDSSDFSHEVIRVKNCEDIDKVLKLPALEIQDGFNSYLSRNDDYEEIHYGETTETPYGERLTYTLAKNLKSINIGGPEGAFINALDDATKVALFWS
ncbi:MAG: hypothetical protein KDA17_05935 [Candidatus Saccharibacteria bacterium]|nr:hypothetical protein [Candidatus Saccharibacteria bacterium]